MVRISNFEKRQEGMLEAARHQLGGVVDDDNIHVLYLEGFLTGGFRSGRSSFFFGFRGGVVRWCLWQIADSG